MTEHSEIGQLGRSRRGVSIGALLIWIILAGAGGAAAWDIYGSELRSRLGIDRDGAQRVATSDPAPDTTAASGEIVGLVKDLQSSQKRTADQLETAIQLLNSEQAASKTTADALAALTAKVDALQHPAVPAAKKPAPVSAIAPPRRPPAAPRPLAPNPEPDQPDQPEPAPGAPTARP
jgi:hypothetical protein